MASDRFLAAGNVSSPRFRRINKKLDMRAASRTNRQLLQDHLAFRRRDDVAAGARGGEPVDHVVGARVHRRRKHVVQRPEGRGFLSDPLRADRRRSGVSPVRKRHRLSTESQARAPRARPPRSRRSRRARCAARKRRLSRRRQLGHLGVPHLPPRELLRGSRRLLDARRCAGRTARQSGHRIARR